ncbi:DUF3431 domain-containing protein [Aspergillus alliaceus]|uniref:DUF3431 domain-containing protein n=1 Tax=Petromyces alliaceus TaxID=209559 RepID=UPI0012A4A396|nr:uncharacterized protein BDW43DRAFT_271724 [Aspergillus alliaceus]KAB8234893.1 hypothetical protein BDW43DRAFT_271724 [Aspergillus alliaceus]
MGMLLGALGQPIGSCVQIWRRYTWHLIVVYLVLLGVVFLTLVSKLNGEDPISVRDKTHGPYEPLPLTLSKALVLAKIREENVSWIDDLQPQWRPYIYTADNEPGYYPVPENKGREGMAYLTHIIDNYDDLTDIIVFMHASGTQWHNDVGGTNSSYLLTKLHLDVVKQRGYTNLRCQRRPGCPIAVRPLDPEYTSSSNIVYRNFTTIYTQLFNTSLEQVPAEIGGICCGQFALSRERIHQRPRNEYVRMRDWALSTSLDNFTVGSVFEMLWHMVFLEGPVSCPDTHQCYCELYGLCDE